LQAMASRSGIRLTVTNHEEEPLSWARCYRNVETTP
jgi:hypothetical protein